MFYQKKTCWRKGEELKAQTDLAKNQYHGLEKVYELDKKEDERINKKTTINNYNKSDLIYNIKFSFYKCHNIKRFKDTLKGYFC